MPYDLLEAHRQNDRTVMQAYGFSTKMTDSECVAKLFEMYARLTKDYLSHLRRKHTILTLKATGKITGSIKTTHSRHLRYAVPATEQLHSLGQTMLTHISIGSHTRQCLHTAMQRGIAHTQLTG